MSYSIDLKKRVLGFIEEGGSKVEATKRFSIGRRTIFKWINKKRDRDTLANEPFTPNVIGSFALILSALWLLREQKS